MFLLTLGLVACSRSTKTQRKTQLTSSQTTSKTVFLGDSITAGLIGVKKHTKENFPWWVGKLLNRKVDNLGHDGGMISKKRSSDLMPTLEQMSFTDVSTVVISYGVNDYNNNQNLNKITGNLAKAIAYIQRKHPKVKVFGILPMAAYIVPTPALNTYGDAMNTTNKAGYSLSGLCDSLKTVYQNHQIAVLDWRQDPIITSDNISQLTWDGVLHPNEKGYHLMGLRIAAFILQNE